MKINLKDLSKVELLELSREISEELSLYENRDKQKVFKLRVFGESYYYETAEKLKEELLWRIEDYDLEEMVDTADGIIIETVFMNSAEFKTWVS